MAAGWGTPPRQEISPCVGSSSLSASKQLFSPKSAFPLCQRSRSSLWKGRGWRLPARAGAAPRLPHGEAARAPREGSVPPGANTARVAEQPPAPGLHLQPGALERSVPTLRRYLPQAKAATLRTGRDCPGLRPGDRHRRSLQPARPQPRRANAALGGGPAGSRFKSPAGWHLPGAGLAPRPRCPGPACPTAAPGLAACPPPPGTGAAAHLRGS